MPAVVMVLLLVCLTTPVKAQEEDEEVSGNTEVTAVHQQEEPTFTINGSVKMQTGMFVPLFSTLFKPYSNEAWTYSGDFKRTSKNCDPVTQPYGTCIPVDHGKNPGSLSMFRNTLQLEGDWKPNPWIAVHAIVRGVRSLVTDADSNAQVPKPDPDPYVRRDRAKDYVLHNFYSEFDLREFYVDAFLTNWLSFRIGRQQVTWGETGQFRLLDVINPIDGTWHFAAVEAFRDIRIPLWIVKAMVEFPSIDHDLEIVWVPGIDRPRDMVTIPATLYGAWGLPYSSTPSGPFVDEKIFQYPKNDIKDTMRIGFRWKGSIGSKFSYSLVYYYTHQLSPPIPLYFDNRLYEADDALNPGGTKVTHMRALYLGFPRQHIAGFSLDYTLEYPWGTVIRLESAIEPDRTYPVSSAAPTRQTAIGWKTYFDNPRKLAISYAVVLTRPTMIRFLNPTQNFTINLQWMHTIVPGLSELDKKELIEVPGYNEYTVKTHDMRVVLAIMTSYLNGFLTPKVVAAYLIPNSGFVSAEVGFRFGDYWRVNLMVLDIFGTKPYESLGFFRDRSEVNLSVLCQF